MKSLVCTFGLCFFFGVVSAQTPKEKNLVADGNALHQDEAYAAAEAEYRKALSLNAVNNKAQHNIGNSLYRSKDYDQASQRYYLTQKNSTSKAEKHLAFHNMGNSYMQKKDYEKAVEAYKNALRNNPSDNDTRYNYALAKELLEKQKEQEKQDQQNQQDQQDQQDQNDQDKDKEGDQEQEPSDQGKDDQSDKGDQEKKDKEQEDDKKGDDKNEKKPQQPNDKNNNKDQKQQSPRKPGQISPEQVKSLLDAMNQQEKKVQDKVNAEKAKGVPVKAKKDW